MTDNETRQIINLVRADIIAYNRAEGEKGTNNLTEAFKIMGMEKHAMVRHITGVYPLWVKVDHICQSDDVITRLAVDIFCRMEEMKYRYGHLISMNL